MADTIAKTLNSCDFDVKEYDVAEINDENDNGTSQCGCACIRYTEQSTEMP